MAVTRERFEQGMTYDEYVAQMTQNRERFEANERDARISEQDRKAFSKPLHALVITEDWCGDAVANFPILGRVAKEAGKFDIRVFLRDQNPDLMDQYKNGEFRSIPVFVFFDDSWREIGHWIERPKSVTEARAKERAEIYASDPRFGDPGAPAAALPDDVRAELGTKLQKMRDEMKPWADSEVLRELRAIVAP